MIRMGYCFLSEPEHNPLTKISSSMTLNAQSTAKELGWDPNMRRDIPTAPLLAPQPKGREKNFGRRTTSRQKKEHILHGHVCFPVCTKELNLVDIVDTVRGHRAAEGGF